MPIHSQRNLVPGLRLQASIANVHGNGLKTASKRLLYPNNSREIKALCEKTGTPTPLGFIPLLFASKVGR